MKAYKLVHLNKGMTWSREKDLSQAEMLLNQYIAEGWTLQQIVSPNDVMGALVAVLYREQ